MLRDLLGENEHVPGPEETRAYLSRWAAARTANPAKAPVLAGRPREAVRGVQAELHPGEVYYIKNRLLP